ncbi:unnamed protein product [Schistocephalus solidus]|uniref:OTU domain-containing protein n=1 Tax=Schistocephalus solidus TaxID=70667 RepID=A0A183SNZ9_SCHSO|nr:unnamed protein product [Schistocephalus solidus]
MTTGCSDPRHRGYALPPPPTSAVVNHLKNIRKGINIMSELHNELPDPKIVSLGNCFLESMAWLERIAADQQFPHIHDRLIKSVWLPTFTDQSVQFLQNYLDEKNKAFLKTLGPAWNQEGYTNRTTQQNGRRDTESLVDRAVLDLNDTWCCVRTVDATTGHVPAESIRILPDNVEREGSLVSYHSTKSCQTDQMTTQASSRTGTVRSGRQPSAPARPISRGDNHNGTDFPS